MTPKEREVDIKLALLQQSHDFLTTTLSDKLTDVNISIVELFKKIDCIWEQMDTKIKKNNADHIDIKYVSKAAFWKLLVALAGSGTIGYKVFDIFLQQ